MHTTFLLMPTLRSMPIFNLNHPIFTQTATFFSILTLPILENIYLKNFSSLYQSWPAPYIHDHDPSSFHWPPASVTPSFVAPPSLCRPTASAALIEHDWTTNKFMLPLQPYPSQFEKKILCEQTPTVTFQPPLLIIYRFYLCKLS